MPKALFLDRDGVLIEDLNYIDCPSKVCLCKNVVPFLNFAYMNKYDLIILTNQSSVSRKIITYQRYVEISESILSKLPLKLYPKYILASFHLPDNSNNLENFNWRKPGTGMFEDILEEVHTKLKLCNGNHFHTSVHINMMIFEKPTYTDLCNIYTSINSGNNPLTKTDIHAALLWNFNSFEIENKSFETPEPLDFKDLITAFSKLNSFKQKH